MNFFKLLALLPQLVAFVKGVLELIHEVESMVNGAGTGAVKRELVLQLVGQSINVGKALNAPGFENTDPEKIKAAAAPVVDTVVETLNAAGVFKHAPAAATP